MKNLLLIILLGLFSTANAQCLSVINKSKNMYSFNKDKESHLYLNGSINILELTEPGVDFDIETGFKHNALAFYVFYGMHDREGYTNYGGGVDYQLVNNYIIDTFIGGNIGGIATDTPVTVDEVHRFAYAFRLKTLYEITNDVGITLVGQYQERSDIPDFGVFEINAGLQFKFN